MEDLLLQQKRISDIKSNLSYYLVNKILDFKHYNSMLLARNNIFVDGILAMVNLKGGEWLLSGQCEGVLHFGAFADAVIHVTDTSDVTIQADAPSMICIEAYNDCRIKVITNGKPKVKVIIHGKYPNVIVPENAIVEYV